MQRREEATQIEHKKVLASVRMYPIFNYEYVPTIITTRSRWYMRVFRVCVCLRSGQVSA